MTLHETVIFVDGVEIYRHSVVEVAQPPTYTEEIMYVVAEKLNMRDTPNLGNTPFGQLLDGDEISVYSERVDDEMLRSLNVLDFIDDDYWWRYSPSLGVFLAEATSDGTHIYLKDNAPTMKWIKETRQLTGATKLRETNRGIVLDGWSGQGFNMRDGIHNTSTSHVDSVLQENYDSGFNHVRVYVHHKNSPWNETLVNTRRFLDVTKQIGLKVLLVFDDSIGVSGYYYPEFEEYHAASELKHLNMSWYIEKAYEHPTYVSRLKQIAELSAEYSHVGIDIMNEPSIVLSGFDQTNYQAFKEAWQFLSEVVWDASGGRVPITVGFISVNFPMGEFSSYQDFYKNTTYIHMGSVHLYRDRGNLHSPFTHEGMAAVDVAVCQNYGKVAFLAEWGVDQRNTNRAGSAMDFMGRFVVPNNISLTSWWCVDTNYAFPNPIWIDDYGISRYREDYNGMMNVFEVFRAYFEGL